MKALVLGIAGALALAPQLAAATLSVESTLDVYQADLSTGMLIADSNRGLSQIKATVAIGDTYVWTIDFAGDQSMTFASLQAAHFSLQAPTNSPLRHIETGQLEFLDRDGVAALVTVPQAQNWGAGSVGSFLHFAPGEVPKVYFWGLRYTGVVHDYPNDTSASFTFTEPVFYLIGRGLGLDAPVPEPATWAMLCLGFGAAGAALRRNLSLTACWRAALAA